MDLLDKHSTWCRFSPVGYLRDAVFHLEAKNPPLGFQEAQAALKNSSDSTHAAARRPSHGSAAMPEQEMEAAGAERAEEDSPARAAVRSHASTGSRSADTEHYSSVNPEREASNSLASTSSNTAVTGGQANASHGVIEVPAGFRPQLPSKAGLLDLASNPWEGACLQLRIRQSQHFLHLACSFIPNEGAAGKSFSGDTAPALWTALQRIATGIYSGQQLLRDGCCLQVVILIY